MTHRNGMILCVLAAWALACGGCCMVDPAEYDTKADQLNRTSSALACANQQVSRLRTDNGMLRAELASIGAALESVRYELSATEAALTESQKEVTSLEQAKLRHDMQKEDFEQARRDLKQARTNLDDAKVAAGRKDARIEELDRAAAVLRSRLVMLQRQLAEATAKLSEALKAVKPPPPGTPGG